MTAPRRRHFATRCALNTTCPPRRAFVASDARRRGQVCSERLQPKTAFGAKLPTPAILAGVNNSGKFTLMPDT
jgi:hypothetical protein